MITELGFGVDSNKLWYFGDEGIKLSKSHLCWDPDEITHLSEKDKLRRSKFSKWLDRCFQRNQAIRKPQSEGQNLGTIFNQLKISIDLDIETNVSNFPGSLTYSAFKTLSKWRIYQAKEFLSILVVLSLVYGGIHLATWNFAFASKTEHLLWKIACIDIMATVPIGIVCIEGLESLIESLKDFLRSLFPRSWAWRVWYYLSERLPSAIFYTLSIPYALSRIYIVVESFISLRRVPIGVYAAVPWVQAIPHV